MPTAQGYIQSLQEKAKAPIAPAQGPTQVVGYQLGPIAVGADSPLGGFFSGLAGLSSQFSTGVDYLTHNPQGAFNIVDTAAGQAGAQGGAIIGLGASAIGSGVGGFAAGAGQGVGLGAGAAVQGIGSGIGSAAVAAGPGVGAGVGAGLAGVGTGIGEAAPAALGGAGVGLGAAAGGIAQGIGAALNGAGLPNLGSILGIGAIVVGGFLLLILAIMLLR